ncbi:hypothetical protein [Leucobacter tenebrionis]|uniref:hypothetical protein n=1 Tax=Leucobacter tenebrionis TaxID=2873270 RepID=UPI001CA616DE|nr:hypothetical protein [Leucobacter tenebrionis]QZY52388.1 hypothetical protein KVY00_02665 [Leucobacter tenebrionis]
MGKGELSGIRRWQVVGVSIFGVIAGLCFLGSFLIDGDTASLLRTLAGIAAGICAVIGVSFAFTGDKP